MWPFTTRAFWIAGCLLFDLQPFVSVVVVLFFGGGSILLDGVGSLDRFWAWELMLIGG